MSPFIIIITEFLMVSFIVIMMLAGKTNSDTHKCVYPTVPYCYLDWKCMGPEKKTDHMLANRQMTIKQLSSCVGKTTSDYNKDPTCGCLDPSYNTDSSLGDVQYHTVQGQLKFNPSTVGPIGSSRASDLSNTGAGAKIQLGGKTYSGLTVNDGGAPLYCKSTGTGTSGKPTLQAQT